MTANDSIGHLVGEISEQTSRLIRDELRLAQLELARKGKHAGIGAGLFGGAGVFALLGAGAFVAAAIAGIGLVLDVWLAALLVGVGLMAVAGLAALVGKKEVAAGAPPVPQEALDGVKADVAVLRTGEVPPEQRDTLAARNAGRKPS